MTTKPVKTVKPAQTVKIGPHRYKVEEIERLVSGDGTQPLYGEINYSRGVIRIEKGLAGSYKRQTVWHEALHGILEGAGIREDHDERMIDAIATGIVQVLQDNPWLRS
jgi:hypothetical protein